MIRKILTIGFLLISVALHVNYVVQYGEIPHPWWFLLYLIVRMTFLLPGFFLASCINHLSGGEHWQYAPLWALAYWFFPVNRLRLWFGHYDPFAAADRRRPHVTRLIASVIDWFQRRRFGREKTGGWA